MDKKIEQAFLNRASNILADTDNGLSGNKINEYFISFKEDYNLDIELILEPWTKKSIKFFENLKKFTPKQQFNIILKICEDSIFENNSSASKLKNDLKEQYFYLADNNNTDIIFHKTLRTLEKLENNDKILEKYESVISYYNSEKFDDCLNNCRLCLEILIKKLTGKQKSLENQKNIILKILKEKNISNETRNIISYFLNEFANYQNTYVKHLYPEIINKKEVLFYIETTNLLINNLILFLDINE